jgi:4-carboxymuconolactone decarboxylase
MDRFTKGEQTLSAISPQAKERLIAMFEDVCPDIVRLIIEFPYGDIYPREGLDLRTRELITIASLTTLGFAKEQLRSHVENALNVGCTKEEIVETMMQMTVYAGFPAGLNALLVAKDVFQQRKSNT